MASLEREKTLRPYIPKRRLTTKDRFMLREILAQRDGKKCAICGLEVENIHKELQLDHINGDMRDNRLENLRLAHQGCNSQAYHQNLKSALSYHSEREIKFVGYAKKVVNGKDATELLHEIVDFSQGSPEMQVTESAEIPFRNWLIAYLKNNKRISRKEAVASGAEVVGVSVQTSYRYLQKMVSEQGPLMAYKDPELRRWFIKAKPELEEKWELELKEEKARWEVK